MQAISSIDQQVIATVFRELDAAGEAFRLLVLPDHATPVRCRTHTRTPVPYLLYDSTRTEQHARQQYNEAQAQYGRYFPTGSAHIFYRNKKNELSSPFFYLYFLLSSVLIFVLEISGVLGR